MWISLIDRVENTLRERKNAGQQHFFFPTVFFKVFFEVVKSRDRTYHTIPHFNDPGKEALENIVGKGENVTSNFSFSDYVFYLVKKRKYFMVGFICSGEQLTYFT